jgi:hypothetical protein
VAAYERLLALVLDQWHLHFLTVIPVHAAREVLHDRYVELLGKTDELEPYRLLEGLPNETLDADEALWGCRGAGAELDVADVILELPRTAALRRLRQTHHGREVLAGCVTTSVVRRAGRGSTSSRSRGRPSDPSSRSRACGFPGADRNLPESAPKSDGGGTTLVATTLWSCAGRTAA